MGAEAQNAAGRPDQADETASLVHLAIDQVLHSDPDFAGLTEVLEQLALAWHCEAALALALPPEGAPVTIAGYPHAATTHRALPAAVVSLVSAHPATDATAHAGGAFQAPLAAGEWTDRPVDALIAFAGAEPGEQRCAIVLIGSAAEWDAQTRSLARMLAAVVAAQLRHAGDCAYAQEREEVTRALIDASPDAVLVMDAQRRLVEFNPAAEALYGWRREDVLGKDAPSMLIPPRYRARFLASARSFLESGDPGELRGRINMEVLRSDGAERRVELTSLPMVIHGQAFFCGFLRDLSEIERAKADVEASERRFQWLAALAPVGIAEAGADGACTFANERWCALTGESPDRCLGRPWLSVIDDRDASRIRRAWGRASAKGAEYHDWCHLKAEPGRRVRLSVAPLPRRGGGPPSYTITLTDLTPSVAVPAAPPQPAATAAEAGAPVRPLGGSRSLAADVERLDSAVATAIPGLVITDERGRVTQVNESFRGFFSIAETPEALARGTVEELLRRVSGGFADPRRSLAVLEKLLAGREPVSGQHLAASEKRQLECDYWPLFIAGEFRGAVLMFRDVTEEWRRERRQERQLRTVQEAHQSAERERQRLATLSEQLREMNELKTQFLVTVSQELRGPLTSIVSYTELVADEKGRLSGEVAGFLGVIERNARQMTRLVQDLLLLSRIDSGLVPLELTPVHLDELVGELVQGARPAAARRGVMIKSSAEAGPPVQADRRRLRQVIENLVANAITFSLPGSSVAVTAAREDHHWRIDVADSGIGIPPNEVGHIFDRFFRASNCRKAGHPGSGLGLAVVKALIDLHGGRVEVASALDRGTTFSVFLPLPGPPQRR